MLLNGSWLLRTHHVWCMSGREDAVDFVQAELEGCPLGAVQLPLLGTVHLMSQANSWIQLSIVLSKLSLTPKAVVDIPSPLFWSHFFLIFYYPPVTEHYILAHLSFPPVRLWAFCQQEFCGVCCWIPVSKVESQFNPTVICVGIYELWVH